MKKNIIYIALSLFFINITNASVISVSVCDSITNGNLDNNFFDFNKKIEKIDDNVEKILKCVVNNNIKGLEQIKINSGTQTQELQERINILKRDTAVLKKHIQKLEYSKGIKNINSLNEKIKLLKEDTSKLHNSNLDLKKRVESLKKDSMCLIDSIVILNNKIYKSINSIKNFYNKDFDDLIKISSLENLKLHLGILQNIDSLNNEGFIIKITYLIEVKNAENLLNMSFNEKNTNYYIGKLQGFAIKSDYVKSLISILSEFKSIHFDVEGILKEINSISVEYGTTNTSSEEKRNIELINKYIYNWLPYKNIKENYHHIYSIIQDVMIKKISNSTADISKELEKL